MADFSPVSDCSGAKRCEPIVVKSLLERAIHAAVITDVNRDILVNSKNGGAPLQLNVPYLSKDAIVPGVQGGFAWRKK